MADVVKYVLGTYHVSLNRSLQKTAHNVTNLGTTAFQKHVSLLYAAPQSMKNGEISKEINYPLQGPEWRNLGQGGLKQTRDRFNIAILGTGYFKLEGDVYTRAGELFQDSEGTLRTSGGLAIFDDGDAVINIPPGENITINRDGSIYSLETHEKIANLGVFNFEKPQTMESIGENTYRPKEGGAFPIENPNILQGFLETANTDMGQEMTDLANATTAYQETITMIQQDNDVQTGLISRLLKV